MKGINKVFIIGNVGADPEAITFQDGSMITNFSVATSESWTDKSGQRQQSTQWHRIKLSGYLAELGMRILIKGSKVYIEGSIHTRKWNDDKGITQYITEIHVKKMELLDTTMHHTDMIPEVST